MTCLTVISTCNDVLMHYKTGKKNENVNLDGKRILVICKEISSFNSSWSKITGYYIVRLLICLVLTCITTTHGFENHYFIIY